MKKFSKIYCDFDGTITKKDCVNTFFELYADKNWVESEQLWIDGKITSQENAISQVAMLSEMPQKTLNNFIDSIEIDDYFLEFVNYIQSQNIELIILSDGFDLFIEKTLQKYNLNNIKFYANHLVYKNNKFSIEFPHLTNKCKIGAGMCKCSKITESDFCYIGDGTSDLCVAKKADTLFATKNLDKYCEKNNINHYKFNSFKDIIEILKHTN